MVKNSNLFKRAQIWVIIVAMMLTVISPLSGLMVFAADAQKTEGQIVAENYDLTAAEKALLSSGLLVGETHTYEVPGTDDNLIAVDTDNKKITVQAFADGVYEWLPVSVDVVVSGTTEETVTLTEDGGVYVGEYAYDGNSFSVVANFELYSTVDADTQERLMNIPAYLKQGLANLEAANDQSGNLDMLQLAIPEFLVLCQVVTPYSIIVGGNPVYVRFEQSGERRAINATNALNAQLTANGGLLDLAVMLDEYEAAASKVEYLTENGAALKAKIAETKDYIEDILSDELFGIILPMVKQLIDLNMGLVDSSMITYYNVLVGFEEQMRDCCDAFTVLEADPWTATSVNCLKSGLTAAEYVELDALMADITATTSPLPAVEASLLFDTAKVQFNLSMFDVTVNVELYKATGRDTLAKYAVDKSVVLTLAENATAIEISMAILASDIVNEAKDAWGSAFAEEHFVQNTTVIPDALTEDTEITIYFEPKTYTFGSVDHYYGAEVTLPVHSNPTKSYDYFLSIDGGSPIYYAQGSVYTVVGNTVVNRLEGKAYTEKHLYQIVADNYLDANGEAILTSGAVKGDEVLLVRYPDNATGIVTLVDKTLTAAPYASGYNDLLWVPYSYMLDNNPGKTGLFGGSNTVEIVGDFTSVKVTYLLELTNFGAQEIKDLAKLAGILADEAKGQLTTMNRIAGFAGDMSSLNKSVLIGLRAVISANPLNPDPDKNAALQECFNEVLTAMTEECFTGNVLNLSSIVEAYNGASDKLLYYYQNNDAIRSEVNKFSGYLTQLLGSDGTLTKQEKLDALTLIATDAGAGAYVDKLSDLDTKMSEVCAALRAPNAKINLDSPALSTLTQELSKLNTITTSNLNVILHLTDSTIEMVSAGNKQITVTLDIPNNPSTITKVVPADVAINAALINEIKAEIAAELVAKNVDGIFYETTANLAALDALIGELPSDLSNNERTFEFEWTYKTIEVMVGGSAQELTLVNRVITLAPSTNSNVRYDYYINGTKLTVASYQLSVDELRDAAEGNFEVVRIDVDIQAEAEAAKKAVLVNYVASLNDSISNGAISFSLIENGANLSIVMKVNPSDTAALMPAAMGMAMGMVQGAYAYVGIDGNAFLNNATVSLQAILDAVMNSGFGLQTLTQTINADGSVNQMTLAGDVLVGSAPFGGKLIQSTMQLGDSAAETTELDFYITLADSMDVLTTLRNLYADTLSGNFGLVCDDGRINLDFSLPQKVYEALLASMLITGEIELDELNDVDGEIAFNFIKEFIDPLLSGDADLQTFENTLQKLGFNYDLTAQAGANRLYSELVDFYNNLTFVYDETSGTATSTISIAGLLNSMDLGALGDLIVEKDTGLTITMNAEIKNLAQDYEALFIDVNAAGIMNKIGLTANLSAKLPTLSNYAVVVLLDDVADLTFAANTTALLNLNGFTVDGDITANGKVIIVDSHIQNDKIGLVTGTVSGDAIIVAGKYEADVTALIKAGYQQDTDGVVSNVFYEIEEDADNNITVTLNAGLIHTDSVPNITALLADIACDILFNGYAYNYLEIAGCSVFDITFPDLIGLYAGTDRLNTVVSEVLGIVDSADLSTLINTVLADVLDFAAISEAIENDEALFAYDVVRKPWDLVFSVVDEGNYITVDIASGEDAKEGTFSICVTGTDEDKAYLADLFAELGNVVDAEVSIDMSHELVGSELNLSVEANANVFIDLTNPNYAIMLSVMVADGIGAPANADLIAGIRAYYEDDNLDELNIAFNNITTAQAITAMKALNLNDSFTAMVNALGLNGVVEDEVAELEALYDRFGKVAAALLRKLDITGGGRTLGSYLDADYVYSIERSDLEKALERDLFKGYSVSVEVAVNELYFGIQLFGELVEPDYKELEYQISRTEDLVESEYTVNSWRRMENALEDAIAALSSRDQGVVDRAAENLKNAIDNLVRKPVTPPTPPTPPTPVVRDPAFVDGTGLPTIAESDAIAAYSVDYEDSLLILDTQALGLTVGELLELLTLQTVYADDITLTIGDGTLSETDLVRNGTKIVATATSKTSDEIATCEYTVIVLGDVNCNGRVEVGDAVLISQAIVGLTELNDLQILATDVNNNSRTDIGDATCNSNKIVDWANYESKLEIVEE